MTVDFFIELSELVDRFRANLVIRGAGVVFEEENIAEFNTKHLNFKVRCNQAFSIGCTYQYIKCFY